MDKNKIMMIAIIALLVILLGVVGVVAFKLFTITDDEGGNSNEVTESVSLSPQEIQTFPLADPIVTNLTTGPDGKPHSARLSIAIGVDARDEAEALEFLTLLQQKELIIRSNCLSIISAKTYEDFKRADNTDIIEEEIKIELQELFDSNLIYEIYIYDVNYQ